MAAPPASTATPGTRLTPDQAAAFVAAHSSWAEIVGQGVANRIGARGADADDLRAEAVFKLVEKAPEFVIPVALKPGTTIEDAFRGYLHPHIVGHCRKAAERLVNGGTYHRRGDQPGRAPPRGIHIGSVFGKSRDRDDRLTELFTTPPCPTEEDDDRMDTAPPDATAAPLPPPPDTPPALLAMDGDISAIRGRIAELEAEANDKATLKRIIVTALPILTARPKLAGWLWLVLTAKPKADGTLAAVHKPKRNRGKKRPVVAR